MDTFLVLYKMISYKQLMLFHWYLKHLFGIVIYEQKLFLALLFKESVEKVQSPVVSLFFRVSSTVKNVYTI